MGLNLGAELFWLRDEHLELNSDLEKETGSGFKALNHGSLVFC